MFQLCIILGGFDGPPPGNGGAHVDSSVSIPRCHGSSSQILACPFDCKELTQSVKIVSFNLSMSPALTIFWGLSPLPASKRSEAARAAAACSPRPPLAAVSSPRRRPGAAPVRDERTRSHRTGRSGWSGASGASCYIRSFLFRS